MFTELQDLSLFTLPLIEIIKRMVTALIAGIVIIFFYKKSYKGAGYLTGFTNSLLLLTLITAVVIMVIGNNLARAFGLVGAMSIIRFRTAVKDTMDIVYIFFSLAIGMAAGVGYYKIVAVGVLFVGVSAFVVAHLSSGKAGRQDFLLQFSYLANGSEIPPYQIVLDKYCRSHKIINIKSQDDSDQLDLAYYIKLKNKYNGSEFIKTLKDIKEISSVNFFFNDETI